MRTSSSGTTRLKLPSDTPLVIFAVPGIIVVIVCWTLVIPDIWHRLLETPQAHVYAGAALAGGAFVVLLGLLEARTQYLFPIDDDLARFEQLRAAMVLLRSNIVTGAGSGVSVAGGLWLAAIGFQPPTTENTAPSLDFGSEVMLIGAMGALLCGLLFFVVGLCERNRLIASVALWPNTITPQMWVAFDAANRAHRDRMIDHLGQTTEVYQRFLKAFDERTRSIQSLRRKVDKMNGISTVTNPPRTSTIPCVKSRVVPR